MGERARLHRVGGGVFLAVALVLGASQPVLASEVAWTPPSTVASEGSFVCDHALGASTTASGVRLHAAWITPSPGWQTDHPPLVYYRSSANNGASWSSPVRLSGLARTWKGCPLVAASGSFVVVAWTQGGTRSIRLRVSRDAGRTWLPERVVATTRTPGEPSLAVVGTRIYLSWTDAGASPNWPRYVRSVDAGVTWTGGRLDSVAGHARSSWDHTTQIAASGSTVFAAWIRANGTDLMGRWTTNGGASWTLPTLIARLTTPVNFTKGFSIAARPDRLAVAWDDGFRALDRPSPPLHVRVYAGGAWHAPVTLTALPPIDAAYGLFSVPVVTLLASRRVGLAWAACSDNRVTPAPDDFICGDLSGYDSDDILWSESIDNGTTWTSPAIVTSATTYSTSASAIWVSSQLRGVLIHHDTGITFRRGFDAS